MFCPFFVIVLNHCSLFVIGIGCLQLGQRLGMSWSLPGPRGRLQVPQIVFMLKDKDLPVLKSSFFFHE